MCVVIRALLISALALAVHAMRAAESAEDRKGSAETPESAAALVVYNSNDPDSEPLARFYAAKRSIPKEHVVGLNCPVQEEISRAIYDDTIVDPLRKMFTTNGWWKLHEGDGPPRVLQNSIRFIALIRGIPLKIAPTGAYPGDMQNGQPELANHNESAVDSELVTLGAFNRVISGARGNEYYRSYTRFLDARLPHLVLVSRLDGPTPEIVRRMISDSIAAERDGLRGINYIDARNIQSAGYKEGDDWLYSAAAESRRHGVPVVLDNGEGLFPEQYPMTHAALYYGWYTGDIAGPFVRPDFRFVRGAVAIHIHSFSAVTLRGNRSHWCAPLLAVGAAATFGSVYEPYLGFTPQIDIFNERLQSGFTFAESAWMASRATSWQTTMVGDPLYRPFKFASDPAGKRGGEWDVCRDAAKQWYAKDRAGAEATLRAAAKRMKSGVVWENLGLLELTTTDGKDSALAAFRSARSAYTNPEDIVRVTIHEVILLRSLHHDTEMFGLISKITKAFPNSRAIEVLQML